MKQLSDNLVREIAARLKEIGDPSIINMNWDCKNRLLNWIYQGGLLIVRQNKYNGTIEWRPQKKK